MWSTVGERVAWSRSVAGISGRELSMLAGLSPAMVGHIERGLIVKPSGDTLCGIARVLGVTIDWLVSGGAPPSEKGIRAAVDLARKSDPPSEEHAA